MVPVESIIPRDLLFAYFRSPENSKSEKRLAKQFDKLVETGKKLPPRAPRIRGPRKPYQPISNYTETRRTWKANNHERVKEISRDWQNKNRPRVTASQKKYVDKNKERVHKWKMDWKKRNPEKVRESQAKWKKKQLDGLQMAA